MVAYVLEFDHRYARCVLILSSMIFAGIVKDFYHINTTDEFSGIALSFIFK